VMASFAARTLSRAKAGGPFGSAIMGRAAEPQGSGAASHKIAPAACFGQDFGEKGLRDGAGGDEASFSSLVGSRCAALR